MQNNSAKQPVQKYIVNIGVEIDNYQWKVLLLNMLQVQLILATAKKKSELNSYINDDNEQDACDSHAHMFHLLKTFRTRNISVCCVNSLGRHRWLCQAIQVCFGYIFNECVIIFTCYYNGSPNKCTRSCVIRPKYQQYSS